MPRRPASSIERPATRAPRATRIDVVYERAALSSKYVGRTKLALKSGEAASKPAPVTSTSTSLGRSTRSPSRPPCSRRERLTICVFFCVFAFARGRGCVFNQGGRGATKP